MAETRRKFTIPTVEDLEDERAVTRLKPLFNGNKKQGESIQEASDDSHMTFWRNAEEKNTCQKVFSPPECVLYEAAGKSHDFSSNQDPKAEKHLVVNINKENHTDCITTKSTVGKTFRETFAFLEDTNHYKETVAKIKEKESTRVPSGPVITKPKSNAIVVNPRQGCYDYLSVPNKARDINLSVCSYQHPLGKVRIAKKKGNPLLKHVRNVPWEIGDIIPDYVLGATTCALFLSLRYHHFNPEYIHERLRQLGQRFELRILLVQVDVKDPHQTLRELSKMAIMADCTLVLAWSADEAARYLETYKVYENKPPDVLLGQSEGDYFTKLTDCLTTVKGINKTDVVSLRSTFGSLANIATASKEDLSLLPGFGPLKAQRLHDLLQQPFVAKKAKEQVEEP